ncbi:MAG: peptidylprolyl isomerase [bacterium]|nr:peptidylprolyl isomerase [bacterium]
MTGKHAKPSSQPSNSFLRWLGAGSALLAVVIVCGSIRFFAGDNFAFAQQAAPRTQSPFGQKPAPKAAPAPQRAPAPSEYVMAVVNGEQITRSELAQACFRRHGEKVLETMVNRHLILAECERRGINITEQQIEDEIARLAQQFSLSSEHWLQLLEKERDVKPAEYRNDIIWPSLALRRIAREQTQVSDAEIAAAMETEFGPRMRVRMISVTNRQKADQLREKAVADPDSFGPLAKDHSEDPTSASAWGYVPPIRMHEGRPEIEQAVFAMKQGDISPVIAIPPQYFIFRCEGKIQETLIPEQHMEDARTRIADRIRESKLRTVAGEIFKKLQAESEVKNVYNDEALRKEYPGVAALVGKRQIRVDALGAESLHRHGKEVLEGMINRKLLNQTLAQAKITITSEDINAEVDRAADSFGFVTSDGTPDRRKWLKHITESEDVSVEIYVEDAVWPSAALKKLANSKVKITEEDLQRGFEANFGERVTAMAIVCDDMRQALQVFDMARRNNTEKFFGELAQQYSTEPVSRNNRGLVPPIKRHGGQPDIENAAFALKPGEISGIVNTGGKCIIIRCIGRTDPIVTDFEAVKDELAKDIHEKKLRMEMANVFDQVRHSAQIDNMLAGTSQRGASPALASKNVAGRMPFAPNNRR